MAGAIGTLLWNLYTFFPYTVDDAFITLRYSRNLVARICATYNATGPRAEGYTSVVWMLLLVGPVLFRLGPTGAVLAAKGMSVVARLATVAVMAWWIRMDTADAAARPWSVVLTIVAYATLPRTAVHAVAGMEAALFTL